MDNMIVLIATLGGVMCGGSVILAGLAVFSNRRQADAPSQSSSQSTPTDNATEPPPLPLSYQEMAQTMPQPLYEGRPWLDGVGGVVAQQRLLIQRDETIIGRSRVCDLQIHDPKISRQHVMLRFYKGHYFLQDMGSSRGTLVNDDPIETHHLQDGDKIALGDSVFLFHLPPQA